MFIWILPASLAATSLLNLFAEAEGNPPAETANGLGMGAALPRPWVGPLLRRDALHRSSFLWGLP
jgi:hypothetical protein